jgi:hypothetical protein
MITADIRIFILRALRRMNGQPMPETTLVASVQTAFPHQTPSMCECQSHLSDLESEGYLSASTEELTQSRVWVLTTKGTARAVQLR